MRVLTLIIFLVITSSSYGQINNLQNLIDTALYGHGTVFVSSKPIKNIRLDQNEMDTYFYFYRDYAKKVLDTTMLAEIILNSKTPDTTLWHDTELKNYILVDSREESVSKKRRSKNLS